MWELLVNLKDKQSRKEAKKRYIQCPNTLNSKYAYSIKDRTMKIKRYQQKMQMQ